MRENEEALSHYVSRKSIFILTSLVTLHLNTWTHIHAFINSDRENTTPGCPNKQTKKNATMVNVRASVCIFPSFATPTWQGNSQSSDLKGGRNRKRGRGEGEIEGLSKSRTGNRVRWTETGKQTSYKKLYTQFRLQKLSCKVTHIFDPEEHHLYKLDRTAASTYGQCDLALSAHTHSHTDVHTHSL